MSSWATLLRVAQELTEQAHREPEKFQNVFTDKGPTAISGELLKQAIDEARVLPPPRIPTAEDRERIGRVSKLLYNNKSIDTDIGVDQIVFDLNEAAKGTRP